MKLDPFESAFKSASKQRYRYSELDLKHVVLVTDLEDELSHRFARDVREFLGVVATQDDAVIVEHR